MLLCVLCVASAFSFFDTATNHLSPSPVVVFTAATQDLTPASSEISTTGAMDMGSISETELVTSQMETIASAGLTTTLATKVFTTAALQVGTTADEEEGGRTAMATVTATSDGVTSTNSSMFYMWREFCFSWGFLRMHFQIL